jgi:phage shock protein PspC (stress-responsive transcriptional regulator)
METKKLQRSKTTKMIGGVCGGLANYFDVDPTIVRLLFVLSFFFLYPGTILIYVLLLIIMPEES